MYNKRRNEKSPLAVKFEKATHVFNRVRHNTESIIKLFYKLFNLKLDQVHRPIYIENMYVRFHILQL